jgi:FixJ family two-component response regulator
MPSLPSTIIITDDKAGIRRALGRVKASAGLSHESFASVEKFLTTVALDRTGCVVADMPLPGMGGYDLLHRLAPVHDNLPVIVLTALDTDAMRTAARGAGAVAFFRKPVDTQALLDSVRWAIRETVTASAV